MNPLLNYVIQVIIVSGLLYSYYHWVLRNKKFHRYNRYYLLGAALLSILIPLLNIPVYFTEEEAASSIVYSTLNVFTSGEPEDAIVVYANTADKSSWFTWNHILQLLYLLVAIMVLLRIIFSLLKICRIVRRHTVEQIGKIRFMNTDEPGTPYSFFRWLFWNRKIDLNSEKGEHIFRHELFHIEQKHSLDILFFELLTVVGWFNPFFHFMKRETKAIHEFLADQFAVTENNRWDYAELLLMQVLNTNQQLVHPFFHNQIKRRIAMITSPQKTSHQYLRKLMVLPVTALALVLFAFSVKHQTGTTPSSTLTNVHTIVIDIGHGGSDQGATGSFGINEKDLAFAIAEKIKTLNTDDHIQLLFTRESDVLPEMKYRSTLGKNEKASLFLSLHINSSPDKTKSGIEVYIPTNPAIVEKSRVLGSALSGQLAEVYPSSQQLLQRNKAIAVLENSFCPAALLQIGYISNKKDVEFISKAENQEALAKKILAGISHYLRFEENDLVAKQGMPVVDTVVKPLYTEIPVGPQTQLKCKQVIVRNNPDKQTGDLKNALLIINGKQQFRSALKNKIIEADSVVVYSAGDKEAIRQYGTSARNGVLIFYNAKITDSEIKEDVGEADKIFTKVEIEAAYPGGMEAWRKYLERNLNSTVPLLANAPAGTYTVVIQFIVELDGSMSDTRALTHHGYGMEAEAIRAIVRGGKWLPAIQNGRQVKAYRKQPITFMVDKGPKKEGKVAAAEGTVLNEVVVVGNYENLSHGAKTSNKEITLYNTTQVKNSKTGYSLKLAADELYIGIENIFRLEAPGININELVAEITPNGQAEIRKDKLIINVNSISERHLLSIYITEGNKRSLLKTIQFKVKTIPQSEIDKSNGTGTATLTSTPEISVSRLKKISVCEALGLPAGTEVISYNITIDKDNGDIVEIPNAGITFNPATKKELQSATAGKMMTFDSIRIRVDGKEKKVASRVYLVVN